MVIRWNSRRVPRPATPVSESWLAGKRPRREQVLIERLVEPEFLYLENLKGLASPLCLVLQKDAGLSVYDELVHVRTRSEMVQYRRRTVSIAPQGLS